MSWQGWISPVLISGGTLLAVWTLVERRKHNPELFSVVGRSLGWMRRVIMRRRGRAIRVHVGSGAGAVDWTGTAVGHAPVPETAPLDEQVQCLRDRLSKLGQDLDERHQDIQALLRRLDEQVGEVSSEAARRAADLRRQLVMVTTGSTVREL